MGTYMIDLDAILRAAIDKVFQPEVDIAQSLVPDDLEWEAWPQMWPTSALGYGDAGSQAMTHAQTVIVRFPYSSKVAVFFGGPRLAYVAEESDPGFAMAYRARNLPPVWKVLEGIKS